MRAIKRVMLWTFAGIGVLIFGSICLVFGPSFIQPLYLPKLRYEIPDGYRGWVQFEVSNPACPPLGVMDGLSYMWSMRRDKDAPAALWLKGGEQYDTNMFLLTERGTIFQTPAGVRVG